MSNAKSSLASMPSRRLASKSVGLRCELGLEFADGEIAIARLEQGLPVQGVHARQIGIELDRPLQILEPASEILDRALGHAHEHPRLGRIALAHDAVDQHLSPLRLVRAQVRHAEQVGDDAVAVARGGDGFEDGDHGLRLAQPEQAVGLEIAGLQVHRLRGDDGGKRLRRLVEARGLVEREAEVQAGSPAATAIASRASR